MQQIPFRFTIPTHPQPMPPDGTRHAGSFCCRASSGGAGAQTVRILGDAHDMSGRRQPQPTAPAPRPGGCRESQPKNVFPESGTPGSQLITDRTATGIGAPASVAYQHRKLPPVDRRASAIPTTQRLRHASPRYRSALPHACPPTPSPRPDAARQTPVDHTPPKMVPEKGGSRAQ